MFEISLSNYVLIDLAFDPPLALDAEGFAFALAAVPVFAVAFGLVAAPFVLAVALVPGVLFELDVALALGVALAFGFVFVLDTSAAVTEDFGFRAD